MIVNKGERLPGNARIWMEIYLETKVPPIFWPLHVKGNNNEDLCLFCNKLHHKYNHVTYIHTHDANRHTEIPEGDWELGTCKKCYNYLKKLILDFIEEDPEFFNDPVGEIGQTNNSDKTMRDFTKLHSYVSTGIIPELTLYIEGQRLYQHCFLCDKSLTTSQLEADHLKINVPVGQKIEFKNELDEIEYIEIIHPYVHCCEDCKESINEMEWEFSQGGDFEPSTSCILDDCKKCKKAYPITIDEYDTRLQSSLKRDMDILPDPLNYLSHICPSCVPQDKGLPRYNDFGCHACDKLLSFDRLTLEYQKNKGQLDSNIPKTASYMCWTLDLHENCGEYLEESEFRQEELRLEQVRQSHMEKTKELAKRQKKAIKQREKIGNRKNKRAQKKHKSDVSREYKKQLKEAAHPVAGLATTVFTSKIDLNIRGDAVRISVVQRTCAGKTKFGIKIYRLKENKMGKKRFALSHAESVKPSECCSRCGCVNTFEDAVRKAVRLA